MHNLWDSLQYFERWPRWRGCCYARMMARHYWGYDGRTSCALAELRHAAGYPFGGPCYAIATYAVLARRYWGM